MTNREIDIMVEKKVSKLLDNYYIRNNIPFKRVTDFHQQIQGIDIILYKNNKEIYIDEKAKFRGIQDKELQNYSFEVSRLCRDNQRRIGWLLDNSMKTDYYCYIFPKFTNPNDYTSKIKNDMKIEFFAKNDILKIVKAETSIEEIIKTSNDMLKLNQKLVPFKNFALFISDSFQEKPCNILISRDKIRDTDHFKEFTI